MKHPQKFSLHSQDYERECSGAPASQRSINVADLSSSSWGIGSMQTCGVAMRSVGNLTRLVLVSAVALAAQQARAVPLHQKELAAAPLVHLAGRKGTRDYVAGESGELAMPSDTEAAPERDSLEECMGIWDAGTHITKRKWREICKRQIKERADLRSDAPAQKLP